MTDFQDAFPNICIHKNVRLIDRYKTIVQCNRCERSLKCPHIYGTNSGEYGRMYHGAPPRKCNICKSVVFPLRTSC